MTPHSLRLRAEPMEERILHSADLAPLLMAGAVDTADAAGATLAQQQPPLLATSTDAEVRRSEIVIIDTGVPDATSLLADLRAQRAGGRPIEIVLIDAGQDGLALIGETLAGRSDITAVHVLAHGHDGALQLGSVTLDAASLLQRAGEIAAWGSALGEGADLLLYGCDVAQSELGRQFVRDLAALTGADVAASADITGAAALGGNWTLEYHTGRIEAAVALGAQAQHSWAGTLPATFASESSGGTTSPTNTYNFSHNVNSGNDRLLLVTLVIANGVDATAVDFNGNALTFLARQDSPSGHVGVEIWYLLAPPVASGTVNVTLASASTLVAGATSYNGVNQATPLGAPVAGNGNDAVPSVVVAADSGDLVVDIVGAAQVSGNGLGANQTQNFVRNQGTGATDLFGLSTREPGAASVTMSGSFTSVNPNWAAMAVEINQASTTVQLTAAQDTYIRSGSTTNYGASTSLVVDRSGGSALGDGRALLQFDLSAIPAGSTITSATLQMQATANGGGFNIDVHRLTQAWVQGNGGVAAANWTERLPGSNWSTAGGTFDPVRVARLTTGAVGPHSWDLTSLVQAWMAGTSANNGIIIGSPDTGTTTITYDSREGTTPPRLVITYTGGNTAPSITSNSGGDSAAIVVPENTVAVTTVTATDPDSGALTYSISGGADAARFAIDAASGALRFVVPPNFEAPGDADANNVYDLIVQVSDGIGFDAQAISVTVSNVTEALRTTGERLVNTVTTGTQETSMADRGSHHAVAVAPSGTNVVVWSSQGQDGSGWGVYGQRYDNTGAALGGAFAINQVTAGDQVWAAVAMDASGRFVVSWTSAGQDGSGQSVQARMFNADGSSNGGEFRVNTTTAGDQFNSTVAMDANGNFVVVWQGNGTGDSDGIFGRRFNADGSAIDATEFRVNTDLARAHYDASVSMNASGAFAVTWDNNAGVQLRRYDSSGVAQGGEINVENSVSAGNGSIAIADDGSLAVVWRQTTIDLGIFMRRYTSAGAPLGAAVNVNTTTIGNQTNPSIAMDSVGNFIVAWEGNGPGDSNGVFAQRFNAAGTTVGGEFRINSATSSTQSQVSLAMLDLNNFVAAWSGNGPGDNAGVFARQYGTLSYAPVITSNGGGQVAAVSIAENTTAVTTVTATDADLPAQTINFSIVGGDDAALFTIDPVTGMLRFTAAPDFDIAGDFDADNVYDVTVRASDGALETTQAIAVTVTNVNDNAPVSAPASATGPEDTLLTVTLSASDVDSAVASFTIQALPANGTLYLDAARTTAVIAGTAYAASADALTLYFSPAADWNGNTGFNFFATDDLGLAGAAASASLTVTPVNDMPVAAAASASGAEDTLLPITLNASDVDGTIASFTVQALPPDGTLYLDAAGTTVVLAGTAYAASANALTLYFSPAADWNGSTGFNFFATDDLGLAGAAAGASLTVTPVNDMPVPAAASASGAEDTLLPITLNASDVDGTIASFTVQALPPDGTLYLDAAGTTAVLAGTAYAATANALTLYFSPAVEWNGNSHFDFFATDDLGLESAVVTASLTITPVNDAPVVAVASSTGIEDALLPIMLRAGDVDGSIASFTVQALPANGTLYLDIARTVEVSAGTPYAASSNALTLYFSPAADWNGSTGFDFIATDDLGLASTVATASLTVTPVNDAPIAAPVSAGGAEDALLPVSLNAGDVDGTIASFTVQSLPANGTMYLDAARTTPVIAGAAYAATANALTLYFSPAADWNGSAGFNFVATDDLGLASAVVTASLSITPVNDAPMAAAASAGGAEDALLPVTLTASDVDGSIARFTVQALPTHGTLYLDAARTTAVVAGTAYAASGNALTLHFSPAADWSGGTGFDFFATDDLGLDGALATASLSITPVNDAPIAAPASASGAEDASLPVTLTASDVDGPIASFTVQALPANGTLYLDAARTTPVIAGIAYAATANALTLYLSPSADWNGSTGFGFIATDDLGQASAVATASLTVAPANDAPVLNIAPPDHSAIAGSVAQFRLPAASFTDADAGDTLTYAASLADGSALPGWLSFDARTLIFSAAPGIADLGQVIVRVIASDSGGASAQALFAVTVALPPPEPPAAAAAPAPLPPVATPPQEMPPPTAAPPAAAPPAAAPQAAAAPAAPARAPIVQAGALVAAEPNRPVEAAVAPEPVRAVASDPSTASRNASRSDAVLAEAVVAQLGEVSLAQWTSMLAGDDTIRRLEELQRRLLEAGEDHRTVIGSTLAVTSGLTLGYVVWLVRGGVLVSSMLSALPAWQLIDPLPVLAAAGVGARRGAEPDDADVERLFDRDGKRRAAAPAAHEPSAALPAVPSPVPPRAGQPPTEALLS